MKQKHHTGPVEVPDHNLTTKHHAEENDTPVVAENSHALDEHEQEELRREEEEEKRRLSLELKSFLAVQDGTAMAETGGQKRPSFVQTIFRRLSGKEGSSTETTADQQQAENSSETGTAGSIDVPPASSLSFDNDNESPTSGETSPIHEAAAKSEGRYYYLLYKCNFIRYLYMFLVVIIHSGWANKLSRKGIFKNWTRRFFVMTETRIEYFSDAEKSDKKGYFDLDSTTTAFIEDDKKNQFEVKNNVSGSMLMMTASSAEMHEWITAIKNTIRTHHEGTTSM
jgi:hypothetical protein